MQYLLRSMKDQVHPRSREVLVYTYCLYSHYSLQSFHVHLVIAEKDPCYPNPCKNQGVCTHDGETASCICTRKFRGKRCECKNDSYNILSVPRLLLVKLI